MRIHYEHSTDTPSVQATINFYFRTHRRPPLPRPPQLSYKLRQSENIKVEIKQPARSFRLFRKGTRRHVACKMFANRNWRNLTRAGKLSLLCQDFKNVAAAAAFIQPETPRSVYILGILSSSLRFYIYTQNMRKKFIRY